MALFAGAGTIGEHLEVPEGNPILRIPLIMLVEYAPVTGETLSPDAKVSAFLDDNAVHFSASEDAWRTVKFGQTEYQRVVDELRTGDIKGPSAFGNRQLRRAVTVMLGELMNSRITFGSVKYLADDVYPEMIEGFEDLEAEQPIFVGRLRDFMRKYQKSVAAVEVDGDADGTLQKQITRMEDAKLAITVANMYAAFRQDIALQKISALLADNAVAPAFADRLKKIAADSDQQQAYPGLLEIVATHIRQADRENMILQALQKAVPDQIDGAREFLSAVSRQEERLPKELSAAVAVMEIVAGIIGSRFSIGHEDFLDLFAEKVAEWPPDLAARLQSFVNGRIMRSWIELRDALTPFVRAGRLPVQIKDASISTDFTGISGNRGRQERRKDGPPRRQKGDSAAVSVRVPMARPGPYEDLVGAQFEREPISRFAVLTSRGDKGSRRFDFVQADNLAQVYEFSNLQAYIDDHSGDKTIRPVLEASIQHLREHPFDPTHTKQLAAVSYDLIYSEDNVVERRPRRFSPQFFPGIKKGPIATKTRLIYDVVKYEGQQTLIIYGAFIKQDVESMNSMPRIREK